MERRRKNNIIIGTLCAVLVLMGVGYAILSTTLNIGATANITGDFDIHFTSIARSSSTISDSTILSTIDAGTGITANTSSRAGTFTAVLQKPTDYVIYTVSVANTGSIDGYLTFSFEDTNSNFDYYKDFYSVEFIRDDVNPAISTDILQPNASFSDPSVLVNTSGTRTYKIKVTFKESATSFPDPTHVINNEQVGNFECSLNLTYSQQAPSQNNNQQQVSSEGWLVDNNGLVIQSPSSAIQNGVLRIPATDENGNNIVSIDQNSFEPEYNVVAYATSGVTYAIITDQTNYEKLEAFVEKMHYLVIANESEIPQNVTILGTLKLNLDTSISVEDFDDDHDMKFATLEITTLDLSNATYLTEIGFGCFASGTIENIIFNNAITTIRDGAFYQNQITSLTLPSSLVTISNFAFQGNAITTLDLSNATGLTTIASSALEHNSITSLTIPSNVETIGESAFGSNAISTLNLSNATHLTTIGYHAFYDNSLTSVDLSNVTRLTSIEKNAFDNQYDKNDSSIHTLQSINASNKTKAQYDAISNNNTWYDDGNSNFHIQYSDQCVGNGCN